MRSRDAKARSEEGAHGDDAPALVYDVDETSGGVGVEGGGVGGAGGGGGEAGGGEGVGGGGGGCREGSGGGSGVESWVVGYVCEWRPGGGVDGRGDFGGEEDEAEVGVGDGGGEGLRLVGGWR